MSYFHESEMAPEEPIVPQTKELLNFGFSFFPSWEMPSRRRYFNQFTQESSTAKSFKEIKENCLNNGVLYEDPDFPATTETVYFNSKSSMRGRNFLWKRPTEIVSNPRVFVDGASRFDVCQGSLGDCWLLAAVATLSEHEHLLHKVVPKEQFFHKDYAGVFHFNIWQYGEWKEVVIDDRLPTLNGQLCFMNSVSSNEFWSALLEKAYAKLAGSYDSLKGGCTVEAMEDFTGGICETFDLEKAPSNLFNVMLQAHKKYALSGCSIDALPNQIETSLSSGLLMGHAYSITDVKMVNVETSRVKGALPMIRIRNPWGNEAEWNGPWSDKSHEWNLVSESEKQTIGLTFEHDGEFWMSFNDFVKHFRRLEICNLQPQFGNMKNTGNWVVNVHHGSWRRSLTAGGCRNNLNTFWINPQYIVEVVDSDKSDDDDTGALIISLMQKHDRSLRRVGEGLLTIGYIIYKLDDHYAEGSLDLDFFKRSSSVARSTFMNVRSMTDRHKLPTGRYVIIPSTYEPGKEGKYMLRIYSEKTQKLSQIDETSKFSEINIQIEGPRKQMKSDLILKFEAAANDDMLIDAYELLELMNSCFEKDSNFEGFTIEGAKCMLAAKDYDFSGKLSFSEFKDLWEDVMFWKGVFNKFDYDKNGWFNSYELRTAFRHLGYHMSNTLFTCLVQRYSNQIGRIYFNDMILCISKLKSMFKALNAHTERLTNKAVFNSDDFLVISMYS